MDDGPQELFAYGAEIDPAVMAARCKSAHDRRAARLADHALRFHLVALERDGTASPSIVPAPGRAVEGALYTLSGIDLVRLDRALGHPAHVTRRILAVTLRTGARIPAWVYTAKPERTAPDLSPRPYDLEHMRDGADVYSSAFRAALEAVADGAPGDVSVALTAGHRS